MPRSELKLSRHSSRRGENVIEIWYRGQFIAEVTAFDGPGIKVITKHMIAATPERDRNPRSKLSGLVVMIMER